MYRVALLMAVSVVFAACSSAERPGADSASTISASASGTVAVDAISFMAVAGKWSFKAMPEMGDSVLTTFELTATSDTTGWTITFPGKPAIPVHVMQPMGDSIVTHAGPYESALRKGVMVNTTNVFRLRDGKLVGTTVAHYLTTAADSVVRLRTEGTRM